MTEPKYPWYKGPRGRDVHPPPPEPERERNAALYDAKRGIDRTGPTVESQRAQLDRPFAAKRVGTASAVSKAETGPPHIDAEVTRLQPKPYRVEMSGTPTVSAPVDQRTGQRISGASGPRVFDLHGQEKPILPLIGPELNAANREKLSRPFEAAPLDRITPGTSSVESMRAMQDKPFTTERVSRQPQNPEEAVEKASPPVRETDVVEPPRDPHAPEKEELNAPSEEEARPQYEPGVHEAKPARTYVYAWHEYGNPPRKAPERGPSQGSVETAESDNAAVPVDDSGGTGGA